MKTSLILLFLFLLTPLLSPAQTKLAYGVRLDEGSNRKIVEVYSGSPAEKAGLEVGDILMAVGDVPVSGMDNAAATAALAKQEETSITINRAGTEIKMKMRKMPLIAFGARCMSGDCENGKGKLMLPKYGNNQYIGNFKQGEPVGECNVYAGNGDYCYNGTVQHFILEGQGTRHRKDGTGNETMREEGTFRDGFLDYGTVYNATGEIVSKGTYSRDSANRLISGYYTLNYRGQKASCFCQDMLDKDAQGNSVCSGWATIRTGDPYEGKALAHIKYVNGQRDSMCRVWDRQNDLIYVLNYDRGKFLQGEIIRISDRKILATNVEYATAYENAEDMIDHIVMGDFMFGSHLRVMSSDSKRADLNYFKTRYVDVAVANPFAHLDNMPNPYAKNSGQSNSDQNKGNANSKYNVSKVAACDRDIERISKDARNAASYYRAAYEEEKGYRANRLNYEQLQKEIISDCDKALAEYKDEVPSDRIYQLNEIRSTVKSHNLPMGIMKNMPTLRE